MSKPTDRRRSNTPPREDFLYVAPEINTGNSSSSSSSTKNRLRTLFGRNTNSTNSNGNINININSNSNTYANATSASTSTTMPPPMPLNPTSPVISRQGAPSHMMSPQADPSSNPNTVRHHPYASPGSARNRASPSGIRSASQATSDTTSVSQISLNETDATPFQFVQKPAPREPQPSSREVAEMRSKLQESEVDLVGLVSVLTDSCILLGKLLSESDPNARVDCNVSSIKLIRSNLQPSVDEFVQKMEALCEAWPRRGMVDPQSPASSVHSAQSRVEPVSVASTTVNLNQTALTNETYVMSNESLRPPVSLQYGLRDTTVSSWDAESLTVPRQISSPAKASGHARRASEYAPAPRKSTEYSVSNRRTSEYIFGGNRAPEAFLDAPSTIFTPIPASIENAEPEENLAELSFKENSKPSGSKASSSISTKAKLANEKSPDKFAKNFLPPNIPNESGKVPLRLSVLHSQSVMKGVLFKKTDSKKKSGRQLHAYIYKWRLYCFESEKDTSPSEEIDLCQCVVFLPITDDDGHNFYIMASKLYVFGCPDSASRDRWFSKLVDVSDEGRLLIETCVELKNTKQVRQGNLVLFKENFESPELRWCFASETYFGYFKDLKRCRIFDLTRAQIVASPNKRIFTLSYDGKVYHWMGSSSYDMEHWYNCVSRLIEIARSSIRSDDYWRGFLAKKSKSVLGRSKELWFVIKEGTLTCYPDIKSVNPLSVYDLRGAFLRDVDKLTFELILVDTTRLQLTSGTFLDFDLCRAALKKNISGSMGNKDGVIRSGNLNISRATPGKKAKKEPRLYWVVLTKETFSYYKTQQDPVPKKSFNLSTVRLLKTISTPNDCSFYIQFPKKIVKVVASNHQVAMQWKEDLKIAINSVELEARKKKYNPAQKLSSSYSSLRIGPSSLSDSYNLDMDGYQSTRKINTYVEKNDDSAVADYSRDEYSKLDVMSPKLRKKSSQNRRNSVPPKLVHNRFNAAMGDILVFDNGTSYIRAGSNRKLFPQTLLPTIVCYRNVGNLNEFSVGFDVFKQQESIAYEIKRPFQIDTPINWDTTADIYSHIVEHEFDVDIPNHPIALTKPTGCHEVDEANIIQLFMEGFQAPAVFLYDSGPLPVYALNKTCGLVVDVGTRTQITPVCEKFSIPEGNLRSNIGGWYVDTYLSKLISQDLGTYIPSKKTHTSVSSMKETLCYVSVDYKEELQEWSSGKVSKRRPFTLDKQSIMIGTQRFRAPELLFDPRPAGYDLDGLADMIRTSINSCDIHLRKELSQNIILSGGTTLMPGFVERLEFELEKSHPKLPPTKIIANPHRKYLPWYGMKAIVTDPDFARYWTTADQYWEEGARPIEVEEDYE